MAAGAALLLWSLSADLFAHPRLQRSNYRGRSVPVGVGVLIPFVTLLCGALEAAVSSSLEVPEEVSRSVFATVVCAVGFGLVGFFDDVVGDGSRSGWRGHVGALFVGEVTSGLLKILVGLCSAAIAVSGLSRGFWSLALGTVVVASAANTANLLDRAPGRVGKVSVLMAVVLGAVTKASPALVGPAVVAGAAAGLVVPDLRERFMLGDAGSNVIGACLGVGLVATQGTPVELVAAVALVALNVAGEVWSLSRFIERVRPLRALDALGRLP